jgi:DNA-binding transcriptional MerR regulator
LKSAAAFRTISEVAQELEVPQHVLRFWESKFTPVRPLKRGGGRRYYRPEDVDLLRRIRTLLYSDGYTIKGVQKLLREGQGKLNAAVAGPPIAMERRDLRVIVEELSELRDILRKAVR